MPAGIALVGPADCNRRGWTEAHCQVLMHHDDYYDPLLVDGMFPESGTHERYLKVHTRIGHDLKITSPFVKVMTIITRRLIATPLQIRLNDPEKFLRIFQGFMTLL